MCFVGMTKADRYVPGMGMGIMMQRTEYSVMGGTKQGVMRDVESALLWTGGESEGERRSERYGYSCSRCIAISREGGYSSFGKTPWFRSLDTSNTSAMNEQSNSKKEGRRVNE